MEQINPPAVEVKTEDERSMEQGHSSDGGASNPLLAPRDQSQTSLPLLETDLNSSLNSSYQDMRMLSPAGTQMSSQIGSHSSSGQDMESYFSPRIPEHSVSADCIATLKPSLISTPDSTKASSTGHGDHLWDAARRTHGPGDSPEEDALMITWRESATQTVIGPSNPKSAMTRPTSVPNLNTKSTSRKARRDGPDYPIYPDQSFAALHSQQHPRPYQPHPLRTRSSHSSQSSSYSSISSRQSRDFTMPSGAKTMGNTPAQSPGLFSPTLARGRTDDVTRTPTLHPSHLQTPTETHKLLKDIDPISGRKLINDYELIEKLGSGQHGTVKLGKNTVTGDLVAVKIVRRFSKKVRLGKTGDPSDMIKKEVAILKKARHGNVVSLLEVIDDDEYEKVYLVLEFVTRGEIVWRKWADKDVAVFEMNRVKREKAKQVDYIYENDEVKTFNETAPERRLKRREALERANSMTQWSLEHGGEPEEDQLHHEYTPEADPFLGPTGLPPASRELETVVKVTADESTPKQYKMPLSRPPDIPSSPPRSNPIDAVGEDSVTELRSDSPMPSEGTMNAAYDSEQHASESLKSKLESLMAAQTHWSEEEEEYQYVPCLTLSQALDAFRDTVLGLEYLHYQGIIHRDIKPANLLWTSDFHVKISDFGVSYLGKPIREDVDKMEKPEADAADQVEAVELAKTVGTPAFYAPELCDSDYFDPERNPQRPQITGQIDVWALGVTLYCMVFGRLPFIDQNEMAMYDKIAREDVFISSLRLKGVEKSDDKVTTNSNKRPEDIVEYEEVDGELRDLLLRLLEKNPLKRISLKEVKQHPWVLRGIQDQGAWVDETDPSVQSEGKKIEISNEDVQHAVVGLVDRLRNAFRRVGSVVRGRDGRKRTDSVTNPPDSPLSAPVSRGHTSAQDGRRSSLRGDEQIFTALRASRENSEHPLSQSVSASPEIKSNASYFEDGSQTSTKVVDESSQHARPNLPERTLSNAESTRTIKATKQITGREDTPSPQFSSLTTVIDMNASSSLGGIFGGAGRRFVNSVRSRERERGRGSPAHSSRSSSAGGSSLGIDDPHASPSIAISSAIAAGHVDQPLALREPSPSDLLSRAPTSSPDTRAHFRRSSEVYHQTEESNHRRQTSQASRADEDLKISAIDTQYPTSPDDVFFSGINISSSSDQVGSAISESFSHPSVPSIVSGASSVSADIHGFPALRKTPSIVVPRNSSNASENQSDEAGYNGGGELDSDSDEDMLVMGGKK
ncbi:MAG: hypothetical protein Q9195_007899 [Heterodermia aff. obscurata]